MMHKSRFTAGAWICMKCYLKEAPADRVCASCKAGVDTVKAWCKSKRIEGAPLLCIACYNREVRRSRFFPPFHANANARRSPLRLVSDSPRAVRVSRPQRTEILNAAGTTCVVCGSCKTCSWRNSPNVPGGKVCMKCCYHQDNRTSKKQKK